MATRKWSEGRTMMIENRGYRGKYDSDYDRCHDDYCSCYDHSRPCSSHNKPEKWNALDPNDAHPFDSTVTENANMALNNDQQSIESIVVKDSYDIEVSSTNTQAALNIQAALQVAIAVVISISIADSHQAESVTEDLFTKLNTSQVNKQQLIIDNSRGVNVTTLDTDITINIQALLQILIALVAIIGVL